MIVEDMIGVEDFQVLNEGEDIKKKISKPFCCDLLSVAMGRTPEGAAWVTVMGNLNTVAVASLTDVSCIILAEGTAFDGPALARAKSEGITVFTTQMPVFDAALSVYQRLNA